jgi:2-keto-4-pentenoate hydratase/2-oxohepta-3-ene-1,7-dioic acid hydratase in catechol pathway
MKLVTYSTAAERQAVGLLQDHSVVQLEPVLTRLIQPRCTMVELLQWLGQSPGRAAELQALAQADKGLARIDLQDLQLEAPVPHPGKIVAIGRNYADHAKETGVKPFEKPRIVSKFGSSVARPGSMTVRPEGIVKLDFEIELAVVMGRSAKQVRRADALSFVAGYTILNDVSARELQFDVTPAQTTFAKSMDGFCPMGPYLLTADELPDPQDVELNLWRNGELMQHGHTRDMLFPVAYLIEYISQYVTLEPGDVIATGTPAGIGAFRTPPVWLKPGDELKLAITHLGALVHGIA